MVSGKLLLGVKPDAAAAARAQDKATQYMPEHLKPKLASTLAWLDKKSRKEAIWWAAGHEVDCT